MQTEPEKLTNTTISTIFADLADILTRYRLISDLVNQRKQANPRDFHAVKADNHFRMMIRHGERALEELNLMQPEPEPKTEIQPEKIKKSLENARRLMKKGN